MAIDDDYPPGNLLGLCELRLQRLSGLVELSSGRCAAAPPAEAFAVIRGRLLRCVAGRGLLGAAVLLAGCAGAIPANGPSASSVRHTDTDHIQIVPLTEHVVDELKDRRPPRASLTDLPDAAIPVTMVARGDVLEVTLVEAPPASLFGAGASDAGNASAGARETTFPTQMVGSSGTIDVPFAGSVPAAGKTPAEIEEEIVRRLQGKANQPQVLVRLIENNTRYATVVGTVSTSVHLPITSQRERLLDAIAKAGGTRDEVNKTSVQVTRRGRSITLPLETIIQNPRENIFLQAGDVVAVLHQPYSYTALGATGRNEEVQFEAQGITLAQALVRSGGLNDERANIRGVFVFRFEPASALHWPTPPVVRNAQGKVPVVYCLNLKDASSFFVAKSFPVRDGDLIYTANAPGAQLQKLFGIIGSILSPSSTVATAAAIVP